MAWQLLVTPGQELLCLLLLAEVSVNVPGIKTLGRVSLVNGNLFTQPQQHRHRRQRQR